MARMPYIVVSLFNRYHTKNQSIRFYMSIEVSYQFIELLTYPKQTYK